MLLGDLEDLDDIIDDITATDSINEKVFSIEEETDIVDTCVQLMSDYVDENPTAVSEPDFNELMLESVKEVMFMNYENFFQTNAEIEDELEDLIDIASDMIYLHIMPKRSYNDTFETRMS